MIHEIDIDKMILVYEKFLYSGDISSKQVSAKWNFSLIESEKEEINPKLLSKVYEHSKFENKNKNGAIFTPDYIAKSMINYSFNTFIILRIKEFYPEIEINIQPIELFDQLLLWNEVLSQDLILAIINSIYFKIIPNLTILDPCVGGGVFIFEFFLKIIEVKLFLLQIIENPNLINKLSKKIRKYNKMQLNLSEKRINIIKDKIDLLSSSKKDNIYRSISDIVKKNLYYIDIDKKAITIINFRLLSLLKSIFPEKWSKYISTLQFNAYPNDYLLCDIKKIQLLSNNFSIIIGNPPYIGSDAIIKQYSKITKKLLRKTYEMVIKTGSKSDLYFYFIFKSISLLKNGGLLGFIIPNRIISNDYSSILRNYILNTTKINLIYTFSPKMKIFPLVNVHPCILYLRNIDNKENKSIYYSGIYEDQEITNTFSLYSENYHIIPQELSSLYNIFFIDTSKEEELFLKNIKNYRILKDFLIIHEGIRSAHFEGKYPKNFKKRITYSEWNELIIQNKMVYLAEIRGKMIKRYKIDDSTSYLAIPLLLNNEKSTEKDIYLTDILSEKLYIRELGDKIYASIKTKSKHPSIGYGGVYFFGVKDIDINQILTYFKNEDCTDINENLLLFGFLVYLTSKTFLYIYNKLFSTGSWGNALKFRSNYLYQIPLIPYNIRLFSKFGLILSIMHKFDENTTKKIADLISEITIWLEKLVDLYLFCQIILNMTFSEFYDFSTVKLAHFQEKLNLFHNNIKLLFSVISYEKLYHVKMEDIEDFLEKILVIKLTIENDEEINKLMLKIEENTIYKKIIKK